MPKVCWQGQQSCAHSLRNCTSSAQHDLAHAGTLAVIAAQVLCTGLVTGICDLQDAALCFDVHYQALGYTVAGADGAWRPHTCYTASEDTNYHFECIWETLESL